jgi:hypothetical protein
MYLTEGIRIEMTTQKVFLEDRQMTYHLGVVFTPKRLMALFDIRICFFQK